jgi:ABC-type Mn2+/Zn2+ transport system permease subunit
VNELLFDPFQFPYMQRALAMVALLGVIGAVVGLHVMLRRMAFFGDALQHTVFPGIVVGYAAGSSTTVLLGAIAAAAATVVLFTFVTRSSRIDQDSLLALLIAAFFGLGVVLVSRGSGFQHDLTVLLFGRILEVSAGQLAVVAAVGTVVVGVLTALHKELLLRAFDPEVSAASGYRASVLDLVVNIAVAATVIVAVQAIGTVLLVAFLVTPIVTGRLLTNRILPMIVIAAAMTTLTGWLALGTSFWWSVHGDVDIAPGAFVVVLLTVVFLVVAAAVAARAALARRRMAA